MNDIVDFENLDNEDIYQAYLDGMIDEETWEKLVNTSDLEEEK